MMLRSCLLALMLGPLLVAACGGTAPRPKLDGAAAGGSQGEGGEGGEGGDGEGGSAGSGGQSGAGGAGGTRPGTGGNNPGGSGTGGSGMGTAGAGGRPADAAADGRSADAGNDRPADSSAVSDRPPDTAATPDLRPADLAPAGDTAPVGATCGGVSCPRLWQLVESCRPAGVCTQQSVVTQVNRCYANQVKVRARVNVISNTVNATFVKTDGSNCYLMDTPLLASGGTQTLLVKELAGTEVARITITDSTVVSCMGAAAQTLTDSSCLPPFSLTECAAGACQ